MGGHFGLIELVLVFGAVLGFAFWELRKTTRDMRDDKRDPPPS